jgi:hypothetical protein
LPVIYHNNNQIATNNKKHETYTYAPKAVPPPRVEEMGNQSQRRQSLQQRTYALAASNNHNTKRKTGQLTLQGDVAFDPLKHCVVCKAKSANLDPPHRGHHPLCWNNKRTKGITSKTTLAEMEREKELQK